MWRLTERIGRKVRIACLLASLGLILTPAFAQMPFTQNTSAVSVPIAAPQALGPKALGKIRIGIAPTSAQIGQGSTSGADYGTPIRNAIVAMMSGPAVEVVALDAHIPIQLQAEAQQKQCDYIVYSTVAVKRTSGGGLGALMKKAGPLAAMTPMGMISQSVGGVVATQAAQAVVMTAQQQATSQLSGFNGQIKSKDDITVDYHMFPVGQDKAKLENSLTGKAKTDGEDVLTPLIEQAATAILTEAIKK